MVIADDRLRLVLFDVDGTLIDSQVAIVGAARAAFAQYHLPAPDRQAILSIVGLSLEHAMARLAPDLTDADQSQLAHAYRDHFAEQRQAEGKASMPMYPGTLDVLQHLSGVPNILLGVATGKSRRGLNALIEAHGLDGVFVTRQVADDHPSKPHPSMILTAMSQTGVDPADTVMIGDTQFDMDMAAAAGVPFLGVSWGYHPRQALNKAHAVLDHFDELPGHLQNLWGYAP